MSEYFMWTKIEIDDEDIKTIEDIKSKIYTDLNRGDGLYMDINDDCTIIKVTEAMKNLKGID